MSSPHLAAALDSYESAIDALRRSVLALEARLDRFECADRPQPVSASVATVSMTATPLVSPPTKGKGRAKAAPPPSKATPAKKERPKKKGPAIPSNPLPLHLAQTFPQEGKPDRHLVTVAIPDAAAAHIVGQGGKDLKQITSGKTISAQRDLVRPWDALGHLGAFKALKVYKVPTGTSVKNFHKTLQEYIGHPEGT